MMEETRKYREMVSALADGQLRGEEFARAVALTGATDDARATWHAYHLVGDVLRDGATGPLDQEAAFMQRLQKRLAQEQKPVTHVTVHPIRVWEPALKKRDESYQPELQSANDAVFRWKMVASLASLAAVTVIGWQAVSGFAVQNDSTTLAQAKVNQSTVAVLQPMADAEPHVMLRDPQLDALLAAHRQFGGASALQMPAGFLRNATFEGVAR
jgi:sigma-E factor negative regulatory protein RseA